MSEVGSSEPQREAGAGQELHQSWEPLADAAALGLSTLAQVLTSAENGIAVIDGDQHWVYANPAACRLLGRPWEQLRGQDFLGSIKASTHSSIPTGLAGSENPAGPFTFSAPDADGTIRDIACSTFGIVIKDEPHRVAIFNDLTGPRAATRTADALAQTAAQLVGAGTTEEILIGLARHGVEGTRALAIGTVIIGDDRKLVTAGGYGYPDPAQSRQAWTSASITFDDLPGWEETSVTGGAVVVPDARTGWEASAALAPFAATLTALDWQAAVYVPLSWGNQLIGNFGVYLPSGLVGPNEEELAFFTALAAQSAVAVSNARLAASVERTRLARELHDSVSQALFSMIMHARAAQLSMTRAGLDEHTPAARAVAQLVELAGGAMAEMRALIFELRPAALAEEGLVAALRKQGAALTAREDITITVDGPAERLELSAYVEEHLYRIASEALHNLVKHAGADQATVHVSAAAGTMQVMISDNGNGFNPEDSHAGHLGITNMTERAGAIGANLTITSAPDAGTTVTVSLSYAPGHQ